MVSRTRQCGYSISIHAPPRGATICQILWLHNVNDFNSRPSARGDQIRFVVAVEVADFNSRPSARGDSRYYALYRIRIHFNSRPSARGDRRIHLQPLSQEISIHAPPRGATLTVSAACSPFLFQFTPLREGRHRRKRREVRQDGISIHAPPRGATQNVATWLIWRGYFNSRPSARGDVHSLVSGAMEDAISIHAPPRGATGDSSINLFDFGISIHAPPRGATSSGIVAVGFTSNFNSRPSARGDSAQGIS